MRSAEAVADKNVIWILHQIKVSQPACPPLTCLCTYPGQLTQEYGVEPSRVLLFQIGLLWTRYYLEHDESHVPAAAKARVKKLVEELKAAIAEHEG